MHIWFLLFSKKCTVRELSMFGRIRPQIDDDSIYDGRFVGGGSVCICLWIVALKSETVFGFGFRF